ncbi:MAG: histidinol-phosphatase [Magnetococcales bacterium]|nr:histidinol-phosphatase [Magnetococcales bacterium]
MKDNFAKINLHTHTFRCKHATGEARDYAKKASEVGITLLGFSDHTPLPDGRWSSIRMDMSELESYSTAVDQAAIEFPELTVLKGLEVEYIPDFQGFFRDKILGEGGVDFLTGGIHFFLHKGEWKSVVSQITNSSELSAYTDFFIKSMESGLFLYMAHPDFFRLSYPTWDSHAQSCCRAICQAASELNVPLEINANGFRQLPIIMGSEECAPYPWLPFWQVASEYQLSISVGSDAHHPDCLRDKSMEMAQEMAGRLFPSREHFAWMETLMDR